MAPSKIFFSYSRLDSDFALQLARDIRASGVDIWIDQLDIVAGSHWDAAVEKALTTSACVLVILTPSSTASTNVMDEVSFALETGKKIIPVMLEECMPPFRLRRLQRVDFTRDYQSGLKHLLVAIDAPIIEPQDKPAAPEHHELSLSEEERKAKAEAENERKLCEAAHKSNTVAGYEKYLKETAIGQHKAEAQQIIQQLLAEQKEDQEEAAAWKKAKGENTLEAYQAYLKAYPDRNYKSLALATIGELEAAQKEEQQKQEAIRAEEKRKEEERQAAFRAEEKRKEEERQAALQAEEKRKEEERLEAKRQEEKRKEEARLEAQRQEEKRKEEKRLEEQKKLEKRQEEQRQEALRKEQKKQEALRLEKEKQEQRKQEALRKEKEKAERKQAEALRKQKAEQERQAAIQSGLPDPGKSKGVASGVRLLMMGTGVAVVGLLIWLLVGMSGSRKRDDVAWATAVDHADSISYAAYLAQFPKGKFSTTAHARLDSIHLRRQAVRDSLAAVVVVPVEENKIAETKSTSSAPKSEKLPVATSPSKTNVVKPAETKTAESATPKSKSPYLVGQAYGGGIIVHIDGTGLHGLIAADKDLGYVNHDYAVKKIGKLSTGNFKDWRLPTKEELLKMYQFQKPLNLDHNGTYWTDSADKGEFYWALDMITGKLVKTEKSNALFVRPVRSF